MYSHNWLTTRSPAPSTNSHHHHCHHQQQHWAYTPGVAARRVPLPPACILMDEYNELCRELESIKCRAQIINLIFYLEGYAFYLILPYFKFILYRVLQKELEYSTFILKGANIFPMYFTVYREKTWEARFNISFILII